MVAVRRRPHLSSLRLVPPLLCAGCLPSRVAGQAHPLYGKKVDDWESRVDPAETDEVRKAGLESVQRAMGNFYRDGMTPEKLAQQKINKRKLQEKFQHFGIFAMGMIGVLLLWSIYDILSWKCGWGRKKHQHKKKGYQKGHGFTPEMQEAIDADPVLKEMIEDLETNGSKALQKYLDNAEMMEKVEELKRKFNITGGPPTGAAAETTEATESNDVKDEKDAKGSEDSKGSKASKDSKQSEDSKKSKDSEESKSSKESESEAGKPKKRAAAAAGREARAEAKGSAKEAS